MWKQPLWGLVLYFMWTGELSDSDTMKQSWSSFQCLSSERGPFHPSTMHNLVFTLAILSPSACWPWCPPAASVLDVLFCHSMLPLHTQSAHNITDFTRVRNGPCAFSQDSREQLIPIVSVQPPSSHRCAKWHQHTPQFPLKWIAPLWLTVTFQMCNIQECLSDSITYKMTLPSFYLTV